LSLKGHLPVQTMQLPTDEYDGKDVYPNDANLRCSFTSCVFLQIN